MSWTDERVALLKKLWGEGRTAAEIASELGGVTRNAVIGKAHRLKLSNRVSPIQQNNKKPVKTETISAPKAPAEPKKVAKPRIKKEPTIDDSKIEGVSLAELKDRMCRWPIGDPRDASFRFCGCQIVAGLPYCSEHVKVAYQAATRNRILQDENLGKEEKKKKASNG